MADKALKEGLERLRAELEALDAREEATRRRLEGLIGDLEHKLEHPDDEEHHHNLVDRMREAAEEFGVEHPRAAGILNHIMMTLSNLGI